MTSSRQSHRQSWRRCEPLGIQGVLWHNPQRDWTVVCLPGQWNGRSAGVEGGSLTGS